MQQGMLYHSLRGVGAGVDIEQVIVALAEPIDPPALERAWERVVARHDILRTGFPTPDTAAPIQEVHHVVHLPWMRQDWRGMNAADRPARLEAYLAEDRRRGFDLAVPPLLRVALFRTGLEDYQMVLTFHHLLLDARALRVVLQEVFSIYEVLREGHEPVLPAPVSYRGYIAWLRQQDAGAAEAFWRGHLAGFRLATPLPAAGPAPAAAPSAVPAEQELTLPADFTERCRALARESEITLNTLLQGAWALLLGRYSGQDDVVFGAVRAGRHVPVEGAADLVGLLINTVPLRVHLPGDARVRTWLQELRRTWTEQRVGEQASLVEIQGWSAVPRGQPLFETIFNFQDPAWDAALQSRGGSWSARRFGIRSHPGYPLAVDASGGAALRINLIYDRARFDADGIGRLLGHFRTLLEGLVDRPDGLLREISLVSAAERRQLLEEWGRAPAVFPDLRPVPALFEAQARRTPGALALADRNGETTYGRLHAQAEVIARRLRKLGVGRDVPVGVFLERGAAMVAALLGVWKAGGAYVPLDPEYPADRVAFMLRDARAPVVLTSQRLAGRLSGTSAQILIVDALPAKSGGRVAAGPGPEPDDLAYVIYTSGSTGVPKGVAVTHRNLSNLVAWHRHTYEVTSADRASQLASPSFDAAVWELWPYLSGGASVHFPDEDTRLSPPRLVRWLDDERITLGFLPTPLAEAVLAETWPRTMALRALLTGGDQLHRRPGKKLPTPLVNHYGPTESTVVATAVVVEAAETDGRTPPIGRPIANTELYVLDAQLQPVPAGVAGELYIGGAGLARGYLHRPELTAEKFVPHPFDPAPGARLYRTGDGVRWRADGQLEFLGRLDAQVKLRGHRIELGEIEAALATHPGVQQCAVVLHTAADGEKRLVAYHVAATPTGPAAEELRHHLQQKLPEAMIPAAFVSRAGLPLTPNGKVDRAALAALAPPAPAVQAGEPPQTPLEETLAAIWCDLLGLPAVGRDDNFFSLGGHSLLAAQTVARMRAACGSELKIHALFAHPTIADLARLVSRVGPPSRSALPAIRRREPKPATLSPAPVGALCP